MTTHPYLSPYLIQTTNRTSLGRWQRQLRFIMMQRPWRRVSGRVVLGLTSWLVLLSAVSFVMTHSVLPGQAQLATRGRAAMLASTSPNQAVRAPELPAGPTGQLLPPGTMAAPYTYRNGYAGGQCTWYVAGRRPIPEGWGNARTWYAHARAAGWSTGTTPAIAAVAWSGGGWLGHVAVVEAIEGNQVLISEMNYLGAYKIDKRWVAANAFRYIY